MPNPIILISDDADWCAQAQAIIERAGGRVIEQRERAGYVTRLATEGAALIVIDGRLDDWTFWTTTPKTRPATRRIPVLVAADSDTQRVQALAAGADRALMRAALLAQLPDLLENLARVPDAAAVEQLAAQCQEPMPAAGLEAIALFNAGEYYRQHDQFEALWMAETGPVRDLYRAILQVGVAYYQVQRGNQRGALKMLLRSIQWLTLLPDVCRGVDIARLRADADAVRAELERVGPDGMADFDRSLLRGVRLIGRG
jgi:hypothetical protein